MRCLGNVIWFLCCGLWQGLLWFIYGVFWSITIVGVPIGRQCFKLATLVFFPFGKEIQCGGNSLSVIANIFWMIFSGIPLALGAMCNGLLLCCTIIGIPFGIQCFKIAKLALIPFGTTIIHT